LSTRRERREKSIENARGADQAILDTITNMDILDALEELIDVTKSTISEGLLADFGPQLVADATVTLEYPGVLTMPWKGFNLFSDGPSAALFVAVNRNYFDAEVPVKVGQPFHYDSGVKGGVKKILLTTKGPVTGALNGSTSVRLFGFK
jgi:hypothetical protein